MDVILLNILTVSVSMTPVIIIMIVLIPILSKTYRHDWTYWLWLGISVRLIMPFSFGGKSAINIMLPGVKRLITESAGTDAHSASVDNIANAVKISSPDFNTVKVIAVVYFAGVVIFMAFKLISYAMFRRNIKRYCSTVREETAEIASHIGQSYGVNVKKRKVSILSCKKISGPMVVGVFRPMLLLPEENYDYIKLKMIISHEMVHIKRYDTAYKFLLVIACALHWFNPFVRIMCRKANGDMEISCDARVLRKADIEEKKTYSLMIIDVASQNCRERTPSLFTGFGSQKASLESRIKSIFSSSSGKDGRGILILVFIVILLFGTSIQVAYPAAYAEAEVDDENIKAGSRDENLNIDLNTEHNINNSKVPDNSPIQGDNEKRETGSSAEVVIIDLKQLDRDED